MVLRVCAALLLFQLEPLAAERKTSLAKTSLASLSATRADTKSGGPFDSPLKETASIKKFQEALTSLNSTVKNGECSMEGEMAGFGCAYPSAGAAICRCPHSPEGMACAQPKEEEVDALVNEGQLDKAVLAWKAMTAGRCQLQPWVADTEKQLSASGGELEPWLAANGEPFDGPLKGNPAVQKFREQLADLKGKVVDGKCPLDGEMSGYGCAYPSEESSTCGCPYKYVLACKHPNMGDVEVLVKAGEFDKAFELWKVVVAGRCEVSSYTWIALGGVLLLMAFCCICCLYRPAKD